MARSASLAVFIALLAASATVSFAVAPFQDFDVDNASESELEEYRRVLSEQLQRVLDVVDRTTARKASRPSSPLSASLPNRDSAFFIDRLQTLSASSAAFIDSFLEGDEITSKTPSTTTEEASTATTTEESENTTSKAEGTSTSMSTSTTALEIGKTSTEATTESSTTVTSTTISATNTSLNMSAAEVADEAPSTAEASPASSLTSTTLSALSSSSTSPTTEEISLPSTTPETTTTSPDAASSSSTTASTAAYTSTTTTTATPSTPSSPALATVAPPLDTRPIQIFQEAQDEPTTREKPHHRQPFNPTVNHTAEECRHLSQQELVRELKQRGTYNPDLMAWDVFGVLRFLDRTITDQYEMQIRNSWRGAEATERNVEALARILGELDVHCDDVRSERIKQKMHNLTMSEPRRTVSSPSLRRRLKRGAAEALVEQLSRLFRGDPTPAPSPSPSPAPSTTRSHSTSQASPPFQRATPPPYRRPTTTSPIYELIGKRQKLIGESHVVPFGCDRRGAEEDGYLRLCSACQSIRRLPDSFFPPFINEVTCDEDNACLYFYDYPHGRCRQKHMNFVVLRNVGSVECQVWQKFNLNVRVSCECFVDEMSFFAKYV